MKKAYRLTNLIWLAYAAAVLLLGLLFSCKTVALPTCKHKIMIPVVIQVDSNTFYTIDLPFCDTLLTATKKKL